MLETIRSTLATGGPHLGDLIYWSLAEARIDRSTLEKIWSNAQLAPELLPEPPTTEKAFKTSAREAALGRPDTLVRLGLENEAEIVFAIIAESRDDAGNVHHRQETRVTLDRKAETVSADVAGHELAASMAVRFRDLLSTHTPDDVRRSMQKVLDSCAAVTLRAHGGVVWVPSPHAQTVRRLQSAVEKIGTSKLYILPVHASPDANRTLGDAATQAITDELAAMKAEVEQFLSTPPDRASTLVRRLDAFDALRTRAALYRSVLSVSVADLDETLRSLTASVESLLNQKVAA